MLTRNERMADVMNRPGVYGIYTLEQALSFFGGFDAAAELAYFRGFGAWLARNGGPGANIAWPNQAAKVVAARMAKREGETDELSEFFALVREFLAEVRQLTLPPPPPPSRFFQERARTDDGRNLNPPPA
ncbi:hypothetical protein [Amycolatopsis silviterrae]|uniref:Uncharacterized protein n=1 Tax=Amycolatopsis silviterrae TaxID=1656914 RepID=A0ABW5HKL2_9PSEU